MSEFEEKAQIAREVREASQGPGPHPFAFQTDPRWHTYDRCPCCGQPRPKPRLGKSRP